jgi:hypothetical protein
MKTDVLNETTAFTDFLQNKKGAKACARPVKELRLIAWPALPTCAVFPTVEYQAPQVLISLNN